MVLMKMLMQIALSRWEERWWWWWRWFPPSGGKFPQQNSSARALDWFRQGSASWRRSFVREDGLSNFFHRKTPYSRRWPPEGHQGAHEVGGAPRGLPPPSWAGCGPPGLHLWRRFFFIYFKVFHGVSGLSELRRIVLQYLLLFLPRIPIAGILPLHVNLVKQERIAISIVT